MFVPPGEARKLSGAARNPGDIVCGRGQRQAFVCLPADPRAGNWALEPACASKGKMALASCHECTNPFSATVRGGAQGSRLARYHGAAKIVCGATDFAAISLTLEIRPEVAGFEGWLRQVACGPLLLVACSVTGTGQDFAAMPCRRQYVVELLSG